MRKEDLDIIVKQADQIYAKHKKEWESMYMNKIIAIDIDTGTLAGVAESIKEVDMQVDSHKKDHRIFVRRVGSKPEVARIR
ncbi:MAG TPA: hypothetical protein EYP22_01400 [Methanosarcinales archaeon]|nr:hypothetical protein [Methanosarcinales archaeon]